MTTNICEGQRLELAVGGQSVRPHTKSVQQWPVVMLSHLSATAARSSRYDSVVVTGRRPSDVYGEAARERWKGRRPMARSAARVRAARAAKAEVASADDAALSSNCSPATTTADNLAADEVQEKDSAAVDTILSNGQSSYVTSVADSSPSERIVLSIKKFYNSRVATEPADSAVVDRRDPDRDCLPVSSSNYNIRKRKLSRQQAAKRVKRTFGRTSNKTDRLCSRNRPTLLPVTNWSAWRSPLKKLRYRKPTSSKETSPPAKDESKQGDANTNIDDDTLPVVPIDEKYASQSVAAMSITDFGEHLQRKSASSESLTTNSNPAIGVTSTHAALSTSDNTAASTRNAKSRKRAEHTIFELFINALSMHKPATSEKKNVDTDSDVVPNAVPNAVPDAKLVTPTETVEQSGSEMDIKQLGTTDQQLHGTSMKDNDEAVDNLTKMSCSLIDRVDTDHCNSTSNGAQKTKIETQADKLVKTDYSTKHDDGEAGQNDVGRRQNDKRRTRAVKPTTRWRDYSQVLVTSRPGRKRQPIVIDIGFDKPAKSGRKAALPAKPHGSCLLPPDFDPSLSGSPGATQKSWKWKTILDGSERLSTKVGPGRPKKTKRKYRRRKGTVPDGEVKWTIHKKLLLGGSTQKSPKSVSRSKFPAKRKLKSQPKSSTVGAMGRKLQTRSMTRIKRVAAEEKIAADTPAENADVLSVTVLGEVMPNDEQRDAKPPTSCAANPAVPSTENAAVSLNLCCSQAPEEAVKHDSPSDDRVKEATWSDASWITSTMTTTVDELVEPLDTDDAVEIIHPTSPQDNVQRIEEEPEVPPDDVTSVDQVSIVTDQPATKIVGDECTPTAATNSDETKVDDESVEALMHLVRRLHDAVAYEKLRKSKEKQNARRGQRVSQCRLGRLPKPAGADDPSVSLSSSLSDQATALALGLGPRFNWLENKINNTMQTNTTTKAAKLRPLLPKPLVTRSWSSSDVSRSTTTSAVVVVATSTTTTSSTLSSPQTSISQNHSSILTTTQSSVVAGRHIVQVSPIPSLGQGCQIASPQGGLIPPVIDLEESSESADGFASTSVPSMSLPQVAEQSFQNLIATEAHDEPVESNEHSTAAESAVTTELVAVTQSDEGTAVDLTAARQPCPFSSEASVSTHGCNASQLSADMLSDEYKKRYDRYENLCALITSKDRELAELNDERKRLHQLLIDMQRAIIARPVATSASTAAAVPSDGPPTSPPSSTEAVTDGDREKDRDESGKAGSTTTVAYRRRPAHRGVTSVRVMVRTAQPPTAHSTKINLSRYNSLFCNYDDAAVNRRPSAEGAAVANDDAESSAHATDLIARGPERTTKYGNSSAEVVQPPSSTVVTAEPCHALDATTSFLHTKGERPTENVYAGYDRRVVSKAIPTTRGMEQVQHQRRPDDDCQTSTTSVMESYPSRHETAPFVAVQSTTVNHDGRLAQRVPEDSQRAGPQIADAAKHQQFVMPATNETILSTAVSRTDVDDQRQVPPLIPTLRPELRLALPSAGMRLPAGAEVDVLARSLPVRQELRPPPPYPHQRFDFPQQYPAMAAPGLSPRKQTVSMQSPRSQLGHSAVQTATCAYRKDNFAGPRTVYVQPMRAESQASVVVQASSACADREFDVIVLRQPCSDVSLRGNAVNDATFLGNRMSPPAPLMRMGVRPAYEQLPIDNVHESVGQRHYLRHVTSDMPPPQPTVISSYHGNHLSNPQTSRSALDGVQLIPPPLLGTANVEQRHMMMMSSTASDIINRHEVDRRPLDELQHFVDGRQVPPRHLPVDAADPRLRRLSPLSLVLMTSSQSNNVDGRSHGPAVVAAYSQQDAATAVPLVRAHADECLALTEADFARRGVRLSCGQPQRGYPPRFPPGAAAPPDPQLLQRDLISSQPLPPRGLSLSGVAGLSAVPLDMTAAKRQRFSSMSQSSLMVPPQDQRMIAAGPTMVTQAYTGQVTRDCMNAAQQELSRRPPDVRESLRHFVQRDAALPFGSSVGQPPDVQVLSGVVRGPLVGVDQPMRVVDHQMVDNMKCETCLRPAMFICSACRKAAYCSVDCQAKSWRLRHGAICRRF